MSENRIWVGTPSQIVNLSSFIFCGLFFWLVIPIFIIFWKWLVVKSTKYELTNERLKTKTGVLNISVDELELYRVQDYQIYQPFFLRLFSLSNIILQTSDHSHPYLELKAVKNGEELVSTIRFFVEECKNKKRLTMIDVQ